jgi:hypothetical protein
LFTFSATVQGSLEVAAADEPNVSISAGWRVVCRRLCTAAAALLLRTRLRSIEIH